MLSSIAVNKSNLIICLKKDALHQTSYQLQKSLQESAAEGMPNDQARPRVSESQRQPTRRARGATGRESFGV